MLTLTCDPCTPSACETRDLDRWLTDSPVCSLIDMFDPDPADAALDLCAAPVEPHAPVKNTYHRCDDDMVGMLEQWSATPAGVPGFRACKAELEAVLVEEIANPRPPARVSVEVFINDLRRRVANLRAIERSAAAYGFTLR